MHLNATCPRKSKNGIKILVAQVVLQLWIKIEQNIVLTNNSETAWYTKMLMLFLSFLDNLL